MSSQFEHSPSDQESNYETLLRIFPGGFDDEPSSNPGTHKITYSSERLREQHGAVDEARVESQESVPRLLRGRHNVGYLK